MTTQERNKVVSAISGRIRMNGPLKLNQLSRVFNEEGIDRGLYLATGPKRWIMDNFPEFFIEGSNGTETIVFSDDPLIKIRRILREAIDLKGQILMSVVPGILEPHGINYREFAQGQKLTEWLPAVFPEFEVSEDNLWLFRRDGVEAPPAPVTTTVLDSSLAEVQQLYAVAFMSWRSNNLKRLRSYNEEFTSENQIKSLIARQFANVLLGMPGMLIDAREEEEPRVAFNTGLENKNGCAAYCVLVPNPKNIDGKKQKWAMLDFACADDDTPLGGWLKRYCVLESDKVVGFSVLEEKALEADQQCDALIPVLTLYLDSLRQGIIPDKKIAESITAFENNTGEIKRIFEEVWGEAFPEQTTIKQIVEKAGGKNAALQQVKNAVEAFDTLAEQVHEMFLKDRLPVQQSSTPQRDRDAIHQQYDNLTGEVDFGLFENTLKAYRVLLDVMSSRVISDEIDTQIESVLCNHFPEISYRFAVRFLMGSEECEWEYLKQIEQIEELIRNCRHMVSHDDGDKRKQNNPMTVKELLDGSLQAENDGIALAQCAQSIYPDNPVERMLISGQMEELKTYLEEHRDDPLYSPQIMELISDAGFPDELTYYAAATRLYQTIGNHDQLAEKYYILGLTFDETRCALALLELYRKEKREEAFQKIFIHFLSDQEIGVEDEIFYLSVLCHKSTEAALEYVRNNYYLFYQEGCLAQLLALPAGTFTLETEQLFRSRMERFRASRDCNEFECAVIKGDLEKIRSLVAEPDALREMGYSDAELERIVQAAEKETQIGCASDGAYDTGVRLYRYQKNRHALAERYMWSGIASDKKIQGIHLMVLLAEESRWEECRGLYDRFQKIYSENANCRQIYLISLLHSDPARAQEYIRANLLDCLLTIDSSSMVKPIVQRLAASESMVSDGYYTRIMQLCEFLADPFVKSVVSMDRTLREYATAAYAKDLGLPEKYTNGISSTYKSDNYPHGMDAISISDRTFCFFGSYKGVSEAFARFALPDLKAVSQLWKIYCELGDEPQQFELLQEYPQIRAEHRDLYLKVLFQREAYSAFITECRPDECDLGRTLQLFIAELRMDPCAEITLPLVSELVESAEMPGWFSNWGSLLIATLLNANRISDITAVLFALFTKWLDIYSADLIQTIVTGGGSAGADVLLLIQEEALANGQQELALYIYNILHIGQLNDLSEQFLEEGIKETATLDTETKLKSLQRLRLIYGGALVRLDAQILLLNIEKIKDSASLSAKEAAEKIGAVIKVFPVNKEAVGQLLDLLCDSGLGYDYHVYMNLAQLSAKLENQRDVLLFFHKLALLPGAEEQQEYLGFVCRFYINAFYGEWFPEEILQETLELCASYVSKYKTADGLLCLYYAEKYLHQEAYACYLLRILADQSTDMIGEELGRILSNQLQSVWTAKLPSYFDLFKSFLIDSTLEEIQRYIEFAHIASNADSGEVIQVQASVSEWESRMLSENDSNAVIKLLFANPGDADVWRLCTKLPLQDNPIGYAKLLFMACRYNSDLWGECADYCEKYEQPDLLLKVLVSWAVHASAEDVAECRKYLEDHLMNQPDYFEKWRDRTELLDLSRTLCSRVKQSEVEYHATLRAVSLIAEKSGFPEAIEYLMDKFGYTLLGNCCNLGVVLAANLLLDGRFDEAHKLLALLNTVLANMNYREMVETLSEMTATGLARWMDNAENKIMLHLILPDGNSPRLQGINAITYEGIRNGQAKETAKVLCHILTMFPDDYGVHNALFNLCCTEFEGYLPVLHKSLRGLVRLNPYKNAQPYYRRDSRQYARMLAVLDALLIVNGKTALVENYNFEEKTGEYYRHVSAASLLYSEAIAISEVRDNTILVLQNRSEDEVDRLSQAYLGCITGNWMKLIKDSWEQKRDIRYELNCRIEGIEDIGLARSALRLLLDMEADQRGQFVSWLKEMTKCSGREKAQTYRQRQIRFVESFLNGGYFDQLENQIEFDSLKVILQNPFEDYSFSTYLKSQYVDLAIRKNSEHLFALVWMIGALICHKGFQTEIAKYADMMFADGNDRQACSLYHAMYELNCVFNLVHIDFRNRNNVIEKRRIREQYESKYRITALFSKDRNMMAKVGASDFHVWSCINLVLSLLYSPRADEVLRLTSYFNKENAKLAEAILRGFDPSVDDREKIELIDALHGDVARVYYCYVLKYPYNPNNKNGAVTFSYALTDATVAAEVNRRYITLAKLLAVNEQGIIDRLSPAHILLLESRQVNPIAFNQKDPLLWSGSDETVESDGQNSVDEIPFYAEGIKPLHDACDVSELVNAHKKIQSLAVNVQAKLELSQKIFQHCLGNNSSPAELRDALLLFGRDYYFVALSSEKYDIANRTILALARLLKQGQGTGYGFEEAAKTIPSALFELLRSFSSLSELLNSYGEHKSLFHYMRSLLRDPLLANCVGQIYEVLDNLRNCYSFVGQGNSEMLRDELSVNYRQLEKIETNRWMELKNRIQKLINDEINELDHRPVLRIQVLNKGTQRNYGYIYGQVCNIGQVTAENIVLQANYDNNSHSSRYMLNRLSPGAKAVFEMDYGTAAGTESLEYYLNVAFSYDDKVYTSIACKGKLQLGEIEEPKYPTGILCKDPNGIRFYINDETGEVYSAEFVGRKKETAELRALVEGEEFSSYKSALVYGIRRSGKTSLLNYLETYIGAHCPNIICVKTDCQNMSAVNCIQYVFIDRVIDIVERRLPELRGEDAWADLKKTWYSDYFCADQHPEKLGLFYTDIRPLLGSRGLYLIIDEIDRLFERVEEGQARNHRNLDSLFGSISALLNSTECKAAVHFVICGSNWLIRYNLKGDRMNQLFQRFGRQVIEIGKLPEDDAKAVLCKPYEAYPELDISAEALEWIWNYTGGLVWHTKVLGEEAILRAKSDFRSVVYPSDVQQSISKVINDHWCKQFYEGCESGAEYQLVDALQSLAAKRDAYVHISRISELLHWEEIETQKTIAILKALKVVAQHPIDQQLYRFEQDIYRRYFRLAPSEFERTPEEPDVFQNTQQMEELKNSEAEKGKKILNTANGNEPSPNILADRVGNAAESEEESFDDWDGFNM